VGILSAGLSRREEENWSARKRRIGLLEEDEEV